MSDKPVLDLTSIETYMTSTLEHLNWQLTNFFGDSSELNVDIIKEKLAELNQYENIEHLEELKEEHINILDEDKIDISDASTVVLNGEFFWEHAAAGEATRLGLGTKYMIDLHKFSVQDLIDMRTAEIDKDFGANSSEAASLKKDLTVDKLTEMMGCLPSDLLPIKLGTRHMLQMVFDIKKMAEKAGLDFKSVLAKQKTLIIMNEKTGDSIFSEFKKYNLFGLNRDNVFFMVQKSFPGIQFTDAGFSYDDSHDNHMRLHNHGQMAMQKTHEENIFVIGPDGSRKYLSSTEFKAKLAETKIMLSYNIEDINYLTKSIDLHALALSLDLGKKGYNMSVEIVDQNPHKPQKGGACFWDPVKQKAVLIESNQLKDMDVSDIKHLNKNFNHYMDPAKVFGKLKDGDVHMHTDVKLATDAKGNPTYYLYFCTPQGDINFLVETAFITRKNLKPIAGWKSPATTPPTVKACLEQDRQEGFKEFAEEVLGEEF